MDLRVLEYFLTVADEENISHAAEDVFRVPDLEKKGGIQSGNARISFLLQNSQSE